MAGKSYVNLKAIVIAKLQALVGGAVSSGTTTGTTSNKLVDSGADFVTDGIQVGDSVSNTTDNTTAAVTAVDSATQLSLDSDIFTSGENYEVGNQLFAEVYGVDEPEPTGYPAAFVLENLGRGQILDTHRNEREWQFDVIIELQISDSRTPEQAYAALLDAVDKTITSFDEDPMLLDSNNIAQCKWVRVVPAEFIYGTKDTAVHRAILAVAVVDIVNRYAAS